MKFYMLFVLFTLNMSFCFGQVVINNTSTSASSSFSVTSSDKGLLIPNVNLPSVTTIALDGTNTAAEGLLIYNTNPTVIGGDGVGYYMFNSSQSRWEKVLTPRSNIGVLPIGSIIAWHNRITFPALTLPEGWQLCNGSVVSDTNSPLNGVSTPNLNNNTSSTSGDNSSGRFLRGSTTSGQFQTDQTNNLRFVTSSTIAGGSTTITLNENGAIGYLRTDRVTGTFGSDRYGFQLRGVENRVTNMGVVYIMRIK